MVRIHSRAWTDAYRRGMAVECRMLTSWVRCRVVGSTRSGLPIVKVADSGSDATFRIDRKGDIRNLVWPAGEEE